MSEYDNCAIAASANISNACRKKKNTVTIKDFIWRYEDEPLTKEDLKRKRAKSSVKQYTLKGEYVATYTSINEAQRKTNVCCATISRVCRRITFTTGGYQWKYENDKRKMKPVSLIFKKVNQLDRNGKFIRTWDSISEAAKELQISGSHISGVCKGKRITTGGYKWEYV